jgi:hypothetical protein
MYYNLSLPNGRIRYARVLLSLTKEGCTLHHPEPGSRHLPIESKINLAFLTGKSEVETARSSRS